MFWVIELVDGLDCLFEASPDVVVLSCLAHYLETLKDVNYVINTSSLNFKLYCDFIQLQDYFPPLLKVLDEFPTQLLKAFLLTIVREDFPFHHFLLRLAFSDWPTTFLYDKDWPPAVQDVPDILRLLIINGLGTFKWILPFWVGRVGFLRRSGWESEHLNLNRLMQTSRLL
jgi:hypothetical protein